MLVHTGPGSAPKNRHAKGIPGTEEEIASLHLQIAGVRGEWNYLITPRTLG